MLNSNVWFKCWIQILDLNVELKCLIQMLDLNVKLKCWNHVCFDRIYWSFWSCLHNIPLVSNEDIPMLYHIFNLSFYVRKSGLSYPPPLWNNWWQSDNKSPEPETLTQWCVTRARAWFCFDSDRDKNRPGPRPPPRPGSQDTVLSREPGASQTGWRSATRW